MAKAVNKVVKTTKIKGKKHVNSVKCELDGIKFDSKNEMFCYSLLKDNKMYGDHAFIREPITFTVIKGIRYKGEKLRDIVVTPDFIDQNRKIILEVKGRSLPDFKIRWKLLKTYFFDNNLDYSIYLVKATQKDIKAAIDSIKENHYEQG